MSAVPHPDWSRDMQKAGCDLAANGVEVLFAFRDTPIKAGGREIICDTKKKSGLDAYLRQEGDVEDDHQTPDQARGVEDEINRMSEDGEADEDESSPSEDDGLSFTCGYFVIIAHKATWEKLSFERKRMELDRALMRCDSHLDDKGRVLVSLRPWGITDFPEIARRYSTCATDDMRRYILAGNQMSMVLGGESGPGARPCDLQWIRSIKDQCQAAGTACFIKQLCQDSACSPKSGRA